MILEKMDDFFNKRVSDYEQHMMKEVDGASEFYRKTAELIPAKTSFHLLDLGCGTGLELDEIFKKNPAVCVTGLDLAKDMLEKLKEKHIDRLDHMNLICANYFDYDFGENTFDAALSVETLHHYTHQEKIRLYQKIAKSLKQDGFYIETDFVAETEAQEDLGFKELDRIRKKSKSCILYHYDTPCTVKNQIDMLKTAGFSSVEKIWQKTNTAILLAKK